MSKFKKNIAKIDDTDFYSILGLNYLATDEQIRESYRTLAMKYHPDTGTEEASENIFQKISEAYTTLSSPGKRSDYDKKHNFHNSVKEGLSLQKAAKERLGQSTLFEDNDTSIIGNFRASNELNNESFNQHIAGDSKLNQKGNKGVHGERLYQFTIDGLESMMGCQREVAINHEDGIIKLPVRIPKGVSHQELIRIVTPSNDPRIRTATLKVKIIVNDHSIVKRDGLNVIIRVPVSIMEAINGCKLDVPVINGSLKVEMPPQKNSPEPIVVKGKGAEAESGSGDNGDLIVEPFIVLPDMINETVKAAGQAIEEAYNRNIRVELPETF